MKKPDIPKDEEMRLKSLRSLGILNTPPEERFDRIVRMTRHMFDVPMAFISIIDAERQWFKSSKGLDFNEIAREHSICAHAILGDETLAIPDTTADHRFAGGPFVLGDTNARFYASHPLKLDNGYKIGTLCIADHHTRILEEDELALLADLAAMVEREFAIMQLAVTDEVTGIYNRRGFILAAEHSLNLCVRQDLPATLAFLDMSGLMPASEGYGQAKSHRMTMDISRHLKAECRPSDIFARLGNGIFASLFINAPRKNAEGIMARFRQLSMMSSPGKDKGSDFSFNYGLIEYDFKRHKSIETLLQEGADLMHESTLERHIA